MPQLAPGDRLGPFEITALIGKGGMGEVYKGRDTRLERDVAIKVSATQFTERFEREARAIAALNHPNICTLYDVGPNYLVMEFVEGAPLQGPLPLDTVLAYARQITSALEAAHERSITHRDLKPGNILVTPGGVVKVLDFGLAKIGQPDRSADPDLSPTLTIGATVAGTILGTAAYMAPEQARGKGVDKRADIWAFGVILHELLTGERLFKGEDLTETLAAVVMREPDLAQVPHEVRRLLNKCLQKDPAKRLRDIGDAWDYLDGPAAQPTAVIQPASKLPWVAVGVLTLALLGVGGWAFTRPAANATDAQVMRFEIPPAEGTVLTAVNSGSTQQSISPDGHSIVYVADDTGQNGKRQVLWVRAVDSPTAQRLDQTEGAYQPFWSPDSRHIAYFADGKLKRVPVSGGSPLNICDVADAGGAQGGTWFKNADGGADGVILFVPDDTGQGVFRVPATGGVPAPVTKLVDGERVHVSPQMLPDGKRFLYLARNGKKPGIYLQELGSDQRTFLLETPGRAAFAPPDMLLYMRDDTLLAQHWDWSALKPLSEPVLIADELRHGAGNGRSSFSVSDTGVLVYRQGGANGNNFQFRWFTREGKPDGDVTKLGSWATIEPSPDGRRALLRGQNGLDLLDLSSGVLSSLTTDNVTDPVWAPDSRRIAFSGQGGVYQMVVGSGKSTLVYARSGDRIEAWTKEGLLFPGTTLSLLPAPEENATGLITAKPQVLGEITGDQFRLSPDAKWIAHSMNNQGASEVWVAAYPSLTDRRKVAEGMMPYWRADGKELFFVAPNGDLMSTDVKQGSGIEFGTPKLLQAGTGLVNTGALRYVPSPDGKRFLVRVAVGSVSSAVEPLHVTLNWPSLVK